MKTLKLLLFMMLLSLTGLNGQAQDKDAPKEITNLMLIPDGFDGYEVSEELMTTIENHEGLLYVHRSDMVFSPQGPGD